MLRRTLSVMPFTGVLLLAGVVAMLGGVSGSTNHAPPLHFEPVGATAQVKTDAARSATSAPTLAANTTDVQLAGSEATVRGLVATSGDAVRVRVQLTDGDRTVRTEPVTVHTGVARETATDFSTTADWNGATPTQLTAITTVTGDGATTTFRTKLRSDAS